MDKKRPPAIATVCVCKFLYIKIADRILHTYIYIYTYVCICVLVAVHPSHSGLDICRGRLSMTSPIV